MTQLQLPQLVQAMSGGSTTQGWDVICSYTADQLNQFLAAAYEAQTLVTKVSLAVPGTDPITQEPYTTTYDIDFGPPLLSFSAQDGKATLKMPIAGSFTVTAPPSITPVSTTTIPAGYAVQAVVSLAAVQGTTGQPTQQGTILTLDTAAPSQCNIVLLFDTGDGGATFTVWPAPPPGTSEQLANFLQALTTYFAENVSAIDYGLAGVNNQVPSGSETVFTPKSFAFSSYSSGAGDDGVLSIYIQTAQGGSTQPGQTPPSFIVNDVVSSPVPSGYTASLILSNTLIRAALKSQLTAFTTSFVTPPSGTAVQANLSSPQTVVAAGTSSSNVFAKMTYGGISISLENDPIVLTIKAGTMSLAWSGSATSSWSGTIVMPPHTASYEYGTVDITVTLAGAGPGPITVTASGTDISFPQFNLATSNFNIDCNGQKCKDADVLLGCSSQAPSFYNSVMTVTPPQITVALNGLNFFLETNLLAPGNQMININAQAGVSTPFDFLVVGNTVTATS